MIGIVTAMTDEFNEIFKHIKEVKEKEISAFKYYYGNINNKEVVIVKSNEGKVNSAIATQTMLLNFDIDFVLNVGIAGSHKLKTYDIAVASSVIQYDLDAKALGYEIGYIFGIDKVKLHCSYSMLKNIPNLGTLATADIFLTDTSRLEEFDDVIAFDMECGAIAQVCHLNNKDLISIKCISDSGDNTEFDIFANKAINILTDYILKEVF